MGSSSSRTLPQGAILKGKKYTYTIIKVLGQGTFGITYLANTRLAGELGMITVRVAIKEFFVKDLNVRHDDNTVALSSTANMAQKYGYAFQRESQNLSKLKHEGIVNVLEAFDANGTYYYSMEYLEGGSLDDRIKGVGMPEEDAIRGITQVGDALQFMHDSHMLHLDLKPKNIMVREDGTLVLIDFGLSKQYDANGSPESSSSIGLGTPGYSPLEQANHVAGKAFQPTIDVYSLGATLYKMLTGKAPATATEILNFGFPREELQAKGVSKRTIDAIEQAMSPQVSMRPASVRRFLQILSGTPQTDELVLTDVTLIEDDSVREPLPFDGSVSSKNERKSLPWKIIIPVLALLSLASVLVILLSRPKEWTVREYEDHIAFSKGKVAFNMMKVKGGTFTMGVTRELDYDSGEEERPVHSVTLPDYFLCQTEVTQGLWESVMGNNPSRFIGDPSLPVEGVSYDDCILFLTKLSTLTGQPFRLPTEAEWEYAAKGGTDGTMRYSGSDSPAPVAVYNDGQVVSTLPVGSKSPNALGLYDMSGNVSEWCSDWYGQYASQAETSPHGPESGEFRTVRGGSWEGNTVRCRVTSRMGLRPATKSASIGLRVAL